MSIDISLYLMSIDIRCIINMKINIMRKNMKCLKCLLPINDPNKAHYGLHAKCFTQWFKAPITAEFCSLQRRSSASASEQDANLSSQNASFYQGKFKKYSAELNGDSYILKMRQEGTPELPEVEYLCNQIADSLKISVAEFYYIDFNGEKVFATKIFIKIGGPINLQHIYHSRPDDEHSVEGIIRAIYKKTQRRQDINIFIKTILFDALIGNHDRHGRNLGFIISAKSSVLSPIYDNVSSLSLEEGDMLKADFNPTGKINTQDTYEPSMRDYVKELKRLGYQDEIEEFYQSFKISQLLQLIDNSFCSNNMKDAIKRLLIKRFEELENELNN